MCQSSLSCFTFSVPEDTCKSRNASLLPFVKMKHHPFKSTQQQQNYSVLAMADRSFFFITIFHNAALRYESRKLRLSEDNKYLRRTSNYSETRHRQKEHKALHRLCLQGRTRYMFCLLAASFRPALQYSVFPNSFETTKMFHSHMYYSFCVCMQR